MRRILKNLPIAFILTCITAMTHVVTLDSGEQIIEERSLYSLHPIYPSESVQSLFSLEDFKKLQQFEGNWRGSSPDGERFYERYTFSNDSTMQMIYFADSTFTKTNGTATIVFREGEIHHDAGRARWSLRAINDEGFHFIPVKNARNRFSWGMVDEGIWTATLMTPAQDGGEATVTYQMERISP